MSAERHHPRRAASPSAEPMALAWGAFLTPAFKTLPAGRIPMVSLTDEYPGFEYDHLEHDCDCGGRRRLHLGSFHNAPYTDAESNVLSIVLRCANTRMCGRIVNHEITVSAEEREHIAAVWADTTGDTSRTAFWRVFDTEDGSVSERLEALGYV